MPPKYRGRGRGKGRGHGRGRGKSTSRGVADTRGSNSNWSIPRASEDKPIVIDDSDVTMESPLTKFVNVTGADESIAQSYLMMCEDDLNEAIAMFCQCSESDNAGMPDSVSHTSGAVSGNKRDDKFGAACVLPQDLISPNSYEKTHGVRAPLPRMRAQLVESPDIIRNNGKRRLPESIFDEDYNPANPSKKTKKLQDLYKAPLDITFKGSFEQAKQHAKQANKLLLVNIQDTQNFESHCINRDIWRNVRVRDMLCDNFTLWQIIKDSPDANWFSRFYEVNSLPYIAILDSTTGKFLKDITTTSHDVFLSSVENFLTSYLTSPSCRLEGLSNISIDNDDEEMSTVIGSSSFSQQENGVNSSPHSLRSAPTSSRAPESEESHETSRMLRPWIGCDNLPQLIPGDATTHILIRCLDGERRSVTFSQTHSIMHLFEYLSHHGMDTRELEVISAYPRIVLNQIDSNTSFKDAHLAPSATLFIQYQ